MRLLSLPNPFSDCEKAPILVSGFKVLGFWAVEILWGLE